MPISFVLTLNLEFIRSTVGFSFRVNCRTCVLSSKISVNFLNMKNVVSRHDTCSFIERYQMTLKQNMTFQMKLSWEVTSSKYLLSGIRLPLSVFLHNNPLNYPLNTYLNLQVTILRGKKY